MTHVEGAEIGSDVERRLGSWMTTKAGSPDLTALSDTVVAATRTVRQRRRLFVPARDRRSTVADARPMTPRRLAAAVVAALTLTLVLTAAVLVGARLVSLHPTGLPGVFRPTGDFPLNAGDLSRPAIAVLADGRVLVVGGGNQTLTAVVFDPLTETYAQPTRDAVIRRGATATTLTSGLVLLTGGELGQVDTSTATAALFDPASRTVAETSHLTVARSQHTATMLDDGRVLIVGGRAYPDGRNSSDSDHVVSLDSAEIYDPATGKFSAGSPLHIARAAHTATKLADGRVLIAGGYTVSNDGLVTLAGQAEIFDPATGTFGLVGAMVVPRGDHSATLLQDGRVLIAGGADRYSGRGEKLDVTATAEVFDPKTGVFSRVGPLTTERADHGATLLSDGRVLVAGGTNDRGDPRSTEIFDPWRGSFATGPAASVGHVGAVAPLLADGRILLAGSGPGGSEVFDPHVAAGTATTASPPGPRPAVSRPVAMSAMRVHPAVARLVDGRILVAGGEDVESGEALSTAEVVDSATGTATLVGSLSETIHAPVATVLPDGRVLIVGDDGNGSLLAEMYDPATASFGPPPPGITAAIANRSLMRVSGLAAGRIVLTDGSTIEAVDAATGSVRREISACGYGSGVALGGDLILVSCDGYSATIVDLAGGGEDEQTALTFADGVSLGNGRVALTASGTLASGASYEYVAGFYDGSTRRLSPIDQGSETPPSGALVATGDGRLLSFGGNGSMPTSSVTLFDPATGSAREVGPMLTPRSDATAIALQDGRILVIGGARVSPDRTDPLPADAELFDPSRIP